MCKVSIFSLCNWFESNMHHGYLKAHERRVVGKRLFLPPTCSLQRIASNSCKTVPFLPCVAYFVLAVVL